MTILAWLLAWVFAAQTVSPAPAAAPSPATAQPPVPILTARVVARYPHDTRAFTEGLLWHDGALYESVGQEGQSDVRRVDLATGKVLRRATIPADQFGEGLALWKRELVSLTWHGGTAYRWDAATLKRLGTGHFATGEGWGMTTDATGFVQSDGSATLHFLDPATLAERRRVTVTLRGRPVDQLNELEMVDGQLLANVWHTAFLLRIDPASGRVTAIVDLRPVVAQVQVTDAEAVANGIAWDPAKKRLFVTGKLWPSLFEIALEPATSLPQP